MDQKNNFFRRGSGWNWADPSCYGVPGKPITPDQFYTEDVFLMLVPDDGLGPQKLVPDLAEPQPVPAPRQPAPKPEPLPPPPDTAPAPNQPRPQPPTQENPFPDRRPEAKPELLPSWPGATPPFQDLPNFRVPRPRCDAAEVNAAHELILRYEALAAKIAQLEAQLTAAPRDQQEGIALEIGRLQEEQMSLTLEYQRALALARGCST